MKVNVKRSVVATFASGLALSTGTLGAVPEGGTRLIDGQLWSLMVDVNAELVRIGAAWVYRKYATDPSLYDLEEEAREAGIGLWGQGVAIPPWEWRRR